MKFHAWAAMLGVLSGCLATGPSAGVPSRGRDPGADLAATPPSPEPVVALLRAGWLAELGRQSDALAELDQAIRLARERIDWQALSALWRARGGLYLELGDPERALEAFGERLQLSRSLDDRTLRVSALADSAYAFLLLGRIAQADHAVSEARMLGGDSLASDPLAEERLGLIASALGDDTAAAEQLTGAARAYAERGEPANSARAAVFAARARDDAEQLRALAAEVEPLADLGPRAWLSAVLAERALANESYETCQANASQAIGFADRRGLQAVAKRARILAARCAELRGRVDDATAFAQEAAGMIEGQLGETRGALARQELAFEAFQIYRLLVALELRGKRPGYAARAFALSERARARAHLDAVVRSEAARFSATLPIPPGLAGERGAARERVRRLTEALLASRNDPDLAARHRDALWVLEEINEAVRGENPLLARVATPAPASVRRVRERLIDPDSVLLSYFVTGERVIVFAIRADRETVAVLPLTAQQLDAAVRQYRDNFLRDPDSDMGELRGASRELYRALIGPVKREVAGARRLLIVPHGALAELPFESLVAGNGRYLIQQTEITYSVSATLALALPARPARPAAAARPAGSATAEFVGLGDPVYDLSGSEGDTAVARGISRWRGANGQSDNTNPNPALGLVPIPGSAVELHRVAELFGERARLYLGADASEEQVKSGALSGYRIVHIASHGLMTPHYQALALSLTGHHGAEDGFLMSSEIAELNLDADLVVLSACRTGNVHSRDAEPVAGMALSLRSAGARSALLSLWNVDDDATAELMVDFYRPLVSGTESYAHSLARAKRAMIERGEAHPFFWAPFVLHGR